MRAAANSPRDKRANYYHHDAFCDVVADPKEENPFKPEDQTDEQRVIRDEPKAVVERRNRK